MLAVLAVVVAVSAANFVLLDYGRTTDDRVGKLTPRIVGTIGGQTSAGPTTSPSRGTPGSDDDHGEESDEDD